MYLDSTLGEEGNQAALLSPLWTFVETTIVSFKYMMVGSASDLDSYLSLYRYDLLHVPTLLLKTANVGVYGSWQTAQACVPVGTYQLMFLGAQGSPYELNVVFDAVQIVGGCASVDVVGGTFVSGSVTGNRF